MGFREPGELGATQPGSQEHGRKASKEQGREELIKGTGRRGKIVAEKIIQGATQEFWREQGDCKNNLGSNKN